MLPLQVVQPTKKESAMRFEGIMSGKEKFWYGLIAAAVVFMFVEYQWEPMQKSVDVGNYAVDRFSQSKADHIAYVKPSPARVAKASAAKPASKVLSPVATEHVVSQGDTCYNIAKRYGGDVNALRGLNGLDAQCTLHLGQRLTVAHR